MPSLVIRLETIASRFGVFFVCTSTEAPGLSSPPFSSNTLVAAGVERGSLGFRNVNSQDPANLHLV